MTPLQSFPGLLRALGPKRTSEGVFGLKFLLDRAR